MDILKYIKNDFVYVPMVKRIEDLEQHVNILECRLTGIECKFFNDWEKKSRAQDVSILLTEMIRSIKPDIDYYKLQELQDKLRRSLE